MPQALTESRSAKKARKRIERKIVLARHPRDRLSEGQHLSALEVDPALPASDLYRSNLYLLVFHVTKYMR
ncbi:Protein of unknown function [Gryllus bimaculatus]|nr:Protein of unknown function [Gryllus bimaculatus]